jgi:hypothetical protein
VLLETHGILRKLSTPCTGPYPVTNVYKNGTIRLQKDENRNFIIKSEIKQANFTGVNYLTGIHRRCDRCENEFQPLFE